MPFTHSEKKAIVDKPSVKALPFKSFSHLEKAPFPPAGNYSLDSAVGSAIPLTLIDPE